MWLCFVCKNRVLCAVDTKLRQMKSDTVCPRVANIYLWNLASDRATAVCCATCCASFSEVTSSACYFDSVKYVGVALPATMNMRRQPKHKVSHEAICHSFIIVLGQREVHIGSVCGVVAQPPAEHIVVTTLACSLVHDSDVWNSEANGGVEP